MIGPQPCIKCKGCTEMIGPQPSLFRLTEGADICGGPGIPIVGG